jgi:hypothetical protein
MKPFVKSLGHFALQVFWREAEGLEEFAMRCRHEEHMKRWESEIIRCVRDTQCNSDLKVSCDRRTESMGPVMEG